MNKNKLSRFLLSTSVGIITALGVSEVAALDVGAGISVDSAKAAQDAQIAAHTASAVKYYQAQDKSLSGEKATALADKIVSHPSGLAALNKLGDQTEQLFAHFKDILVGGVVLTPEHFESFLSQIADATTLRELGINNVRDLKSPEIESLVAPAQVTDAKEAIYFAEQRKESGEFEKSAEFFLKARDLTVEADTTLRTEYAEKALLMYSEHFIHHVARVSSVTEENVTAAQTLLVKIKELAESTNTVAAYLRAASCAEELGTAIYDLALKQTAARDLLTETAAITAEDVKISKTYVSLYNADIVARDMHEKVAAKNSGQAKTQELVAAANAMRLAIGALTDAQTRSSTAVFSGDVTVSEKLYSEAIAFKTMHNDQLPTTSGVVASEALKTLAASSQILLSKYKASWNARSKFTVGTSQYNDLNTQYTGVGTTITDELAAANTKYDGINKAEQYLSARDIVAVRSVRAEMLYRKVLDAAEVDPVVETNVTNAVSELKDHVRSSNAASVLDVINGLDTALKSTLDEVKASAIRSARTECNRILANSYALVAKAYATELEKVSTVALGATRANRSMWLGYFLDFARFANNKAAWEAGVKAIDVVLADTDVSIAADDARLVKALALTAKAEALLKRNTVADDTSVATVDATGALTAGLLFDADAVATAMTAGASHVKARDNLRKAFESAVDLHNSAAAKQGLRAKWAEVESAYADDKLTVTDTALSSGFEKGNNLFVAAILAQIQAAAANADAAAVKADLETWIDASANQIDASLKIGSTIPAGSYIMTQLAVGAVHAVGLTTADITLTAGQTGNYFLPGLAAHYAAMKAAPTAKIGTDTVSLSELTTIEALYKHLMEKYASIRKDSDIYKGYASAAEAFDKARKAKTDWAAAEVDGLSSVAVSATWEAKRDAAGAAYTAAANYESKRAGALLSAAGIGASTGYNTLALISALTIDLAPVYVTEDVLKSLHRRAVSLKTAATVYNRTLAASGSNAAVAANTASRNTAVAAAVRGGNTGAYELALDLVNTAYQGLAGFNQVSDYTTFVGERLAAITTAYRKVNAAWLSDLKDTIALATTGTDAADHRNALAALLAPNVAIAGGANNMADRIFDIGALFDGTPYTRTHSALRDIGSGYETVLRTLEALGSTTEARQGFVYDELKLNAEAAKAKAPTAYVGGTPATEQQMKDVIAQLTERADIAEAVLSAAYGATRSNLPSTNKDKSYKIQRAEAITAVTSLIQEGARDFAKAVLDEESGVATADLKAKTAHQLARLLKAKAASERIRFDNINVAADKDSARDYYLHAITALNKEITAILSQTESSLMTDRNARLGAAYESLADAYKQAILNGADAALEKEQYTAIFNQAQILYREGNLDHSAKILEELSANDGAAVVQGAILKELAEQYEAAGRFLQAAKIYKASTEKHVLQKDAEAAYESAENALKAAQQSSHPEACAAAAEAFNLIGSTLEFHGRVRAEAYQKAAGSYILGEMYEEAAVAYSASGAEWTKIGDHMQAGNQHEKAAWALSSVKSLTVDQRIKIIQAIEKAAHQLQIAGATERLEKLVELAEAQIKVIQEGSDTLVTGKLKLAVVAAAGALYEKALAFQKDGELSYADAAQERIGALLKVVDSDGKEANIQLNVAKLYSLQKKHAKAADAYIKSAEGHVEGGKLLDAANAYAMAADAVLAASEGNRIKDSILPALLAISKDVRAGGSKIGRSDQFDIHLAVVEVYRDLAKLNPSELNNALAEVEAILKEAPTQKDMQARIAGVKIELLSQKAVTLKTDVAKAAILAQAQTAFDGVKGLTGETPATTVKVKKFVAMAAHSLVKMYELTRVIHTANGLVYIDALRTVIDTAEAAAKAAFDAASTIKMSYDVALEATALAATSMESYTKGMIYYIATEKDKARTDDMVYLRGMPDRTTKLVENAVRATLLGILKSREEVAVIQSNFVEVFDASNKICAFIVGLRNSESAHDSYGNAAKATELKATMATTATAVKGAAGDLKDRAAAAQALAPVARAAATDVLVADKADAVAKSVSTAVKAQAALVTTAPKDKVTANDVTNHVQALVETILGNGKATGGNTKGVVGDLQSAQGGSTNSANAVINTRS